MTEYCNFVWDGDNEHWVCTRCGYVSPAPKNAIPISECKPSPSLFKQAINYTKAVATHIATGAKTRTDEEVAERLKICESCERYNLKGGFCTVCGCKCNANKSAFTNKIRMQSQKCPEGKWN